MTGQDAYFEELISAYLDGEVSSEERRQVEHLLATNSECRRFFELLQKLEHTLQHLPTYRSGPHLTSRIMARVEQLRPARDQAGTEALDAELLSAYLDGEASESERLRVERCLQANPEYREELEQLELLDRSLRSLPEYRLSEGFTERVLRRIDQIQTPAPRVAEVRPAGRDMVATKQAAGWRTVVMAAVAVAAALLLIVYAFDTARQPTDIARSGSPQGPATLPPDPPLPPDQAPPKPWQPPKPETEIAELPKAKMQAPQTPPDTSAWQLVHALQQQSRFKLLLVYEVTIMPEGVAQSAFLNLLKRHGIRPYQALPIGERDRRSLLKQRFLDGVQVNTKGPASMDEVRLFLVSCTGRQAEAMWLDMTNRPPGFGSLFMNLTTRDAGDGVLNRLCDASQIEQRRGEAVELLGNLAMLSSAARHLGVFGGIKWVEPELLYPAATESPKEPGGAAPKLDADLTGEFRCELLFVVRNLQPLDEAPATSSR